MIKIKSRDHDGCEILINDDNIIYVAPSLSGVGCIIYFVGDSYISCYDSLEEIENKTHPVSTFEQFGIPQGVPVTEAVFSLQSNEELPPSKDGYPGYLPQNPSGNVDKRTNAYKDYVASLEK